VVLDEPEVVETDFIGLYALLERLLDKRGVVYNVVFVGALHFVK
jgi:hypothetical protein